MLGSGSGSGSVSGRSSGSGCVGEHQAVRGWSGGIMVACDSKNEAFIAFVGNIGGVRVLLLVRRMVLILIGSVLGG